MLKPWSFLSASSLLFAGVLWARLPAVAAQIVASDPVQNIQYFPANDEAAVSQSPGASGEVNKPPKPAVPSQGTQAVPNSARRPFTITGTLTSGYYSSYTRGGSNEEQRTRFVPAGAAFDINGYYLTPDLLEYSIQPEFNASPQASDAGFQGGTGIRMRFTALRKQAFPVTFHYANVRLEDVYFGSLSQLSSYTFNNRTKELGLTTQLKHAGLPTATIDWGIGSVVSQSSISEIPDYISKSGHRNINLTYEQWGWSFRSYAGYQQQTSSLFTPLMDGSNSSVLHQELTQYRGSARRSFLKDWDLYVDAGSQSTANFLLDRPIDLTSHHANVNLRMFQSGRWKTSIRAGYTSNISGLFLTKLVSNLNGNGSFAPDASILLPIQRSTSNLNFSGFTTVDLSHGLSLYASADRTSISPADAAILGSSYFTMSGGLTYSHAFRWGHLSGQYGRSHGNGSVTGQRGRIAGQNYVVTFQPGNWKDLQLDFSVRGNDQRIINLLSAHESSFASEGSVGSRLFGQYRIRIGGGWQKSSFVNGSNTFRTKGYTARVALEHPRIQVSGSLNSISGNSLQPPDNVLSGIGIDSALLIPMAITPSDFRGVTFSLHAIPTRKFELSARYTRSMQHLEGVVTNDFEVIDAAGTFHFRKLKFVAGFFRSAQVYTNYFTAFPETERGRLYFRISRTLEF